MGAQWSVLGGVFDVFDRFVGFRCSFNNYFCICGRFLGLLLVSKDFFDVFDRFFVFKGCFYAFDQFLGLTLNLLLVLVFLLDLWDFSIYLTVFSVFVCYF